MDEANRQLLEEGLRSFGLAPSVASVEALGRHLSMVVDWNQRVNLTAITDEREMVIKHLLDSAAVLRVFRPEREMRVIDVGTGAGFPGVTLKSLAPELNVTLLESLGKRCKFLEAVGEEVIAPLLGSLSGYQVLWSRAEDAGQSPDHRERYDLVTARAVAELRVLAEYTLPFVKIGGLLVALKGPGATTEVEAARRAVEVLGGAIEEIVEVTLPEGVGSRFLVLIRKVRATPRLYPRKAGTPSKSPL